MTTLRTLLVIAGLDARDVARTDALAGELAKFSGCWRIGPAVWVVQAAFEPNQFLEVLRPVLDDADGLLVVEITSLRSAWRTAETED